MSLLLGPHELIPRTGLTIGDVLRQLHECASREWSDFLHKSGKEPTANAWLCRIEPIAGIGYLSSIWRLCFLVDDGHEFRAVIKSPNPTYVAEVNLIKSKEELDFLLPLLVKFHNREVHFYAELVPNFLADTKFASFLPRAFAWKSCEDVAGLATAFLILEDLSERGSHPQAMDSLSNQQIESLICALAQLHAHSLAIPSTQLDSLRLRHTHLYKYPPEQVFERLCDPGSECGHFFNENRQALEQMVQWVLERAERGEDICAEFGIQPILSHGDLWTNNLLFSKQNPNQLSAILDWQFARPSTGLNDLAHLLLGSVDVELRRERQAGWLRLYREDMARWAKQQLGRVVPIDSEELAQRIFQRHMPAEIYFQMQMLVLNEAVGESGNSAKRRQIRIREMFAEWLAAEKTQMVKQD